jgi:hypothetical protein
MYTGYIGAGVEISADYDTFNYFELDITVII